MAHIPNGYGQVNLFFTGTGWPSGGEVTFAFRNIANEDPATNAATIRDIIDTRLAEQIPENLTISSILVKHGPNDSGPFDLLGTSIVGTGSSAQVQPNMAILVRKTTGLGGRRGRGRWYWPVAEDQVDTGGALQSFVVTGMNADCADVLADLTAADLPMMLAHTAEDLTPATVTSMSCQAIAATQRRRLRR